MKYIRYEIGRMSKCYVCFVDYEKAFDKIDRNLLLTKLQKIGISNHFLRVLSTLYQHNFIMVSVEGSLTDKISQRIGVPQGDKLSPILFSLFISDLSSILESTGCFVVFYADDLAVASSSLQSLQHALDKLDKYCALNLMNVNVKKTKMMKFRKGGPLAHTDAVKYRGQPIEFVNNFKYLGITLSTTLSPNAHLSSLYNNARSSFNSARRLFDAIVYPSGAYGIQVFSLDSDSYSVSAHCTKLLAQFLKLWCGISKYSNSTLLVSNLLYNDFLNVRAAKGSKRRQLSQYYCNGLHHMLCYLQNCYGNRTTSIDDTVCTCKFCNFSILD